MVFAFNDGMSILYKCAFIGLELILKNLVNTRKDTRQISVETREQLMKRDVFINGSNIECN